MALVKQMVETIRQRLVYILIVPVVWHLLGSTQAAATFPDLFELWSALLQIGSDSFEPEVHIPLTLFRIILVFLISMPLGILVGVLMGRNSRLEAFFSPFVLFSMTFPSLVWAFLGVLWFGLTELLVPVMVGVIIITPYITINIWEGTKSIDQELMEMARAFGANRNQMWLDIAVPNLMPYIYSMVRITLAVSWKVMLVAELFGAQSGVGFIIKEYFSQQRIDMILAWALPALVVVYILERLISYQERRYYEWRPEIEEINQEVIDA